MRLISAAGQTLRARKWWSSKMPPLMGVAGVAILSSHTDAADAYARVVAALFLSGIAAAGFAYVVNDIYDVEADRRAGKENRMAGLAAPARWALALGLLAACFLPALWVDYGAPALILLGIECAGLAAYSVPPVRLKERRVLGAIGDAAIAHFLPTLFLIAVFAHPGRGLTWGDGPWVIALATWSFAAGLKNILWHQIVDREGDLQSGQRTLATSVDATAVRGWVYRRCYPVEVGAFVGVVLATLDVAPSLALALGTALVLDGARVALGWRYVFDQDCGAAQGRYLPLMNNRFYETWFPLAVGVHAGLRDAAYWGLPIVVLLAFPFGFLGELRDLGTLAEAVGRRLRARWRGRRRRARRGWRLELHEGAVATLARRLGSGWRVEIREPSDVVWHVKVSRAPQPMRRGEVYLVQMSLRADAARRLTLCATRGRPPWDALGLSEELRVDREWRTIRQRFVASDDAPRAGVHLLLGGEHAGIEMKGFRFRRLERVREEARGAEDAGEGIA